MNRKRVLSTLIFCLAIVCLSGCKKRIIYEDAHYKIQLKNLVSYYTASPDLLVRTDSGEIKINLNPFGKILIPQEKITAVQIAQINADSINIQFNAADTLLKYQQETISINIKKTLDSIRKNPTKY